MTIGIVTDSNAQLPAELAEAHQIAVVPLPVVIDGVEHHEGVDLDVEDFYRRLAAGAEISTSQPSPGEIAAIYDVLADEGCEQVVSIHVGADLSGTVNAARLASQLARCDVTVVDTGQASFSVGCAVLAAADTRLAGGTAADIADAARTISSQVRNVFIMGGLELARASGRVEMTAELEQLDESLEIPVMTFVDGDLVVLGTANDVDEATAIMSEVVLESTALGPVRVGVGVADRETFGFYDAFERELGHQPGLELIRYRCGPTVGAFTGLGTVGACWVPLNG